MLPLRSFAYSIVCLIAVVACGDNAGSGPDGAAGPPCSDHIDNDGDGMIDFPDDLGCDSANDDSEDSPAKPKCSDNRDNDGDGKIDFPNDPGCTQPQFDDESDDCPNGPNCPQCADGKDNDGNGQTDYPADSMGCTSAGDLIEFTDNPVACGANVAINMLPPSGVVTGTLMGNASTLGSPCGGGNGGPIVAYILHLNKPQVIVASTVDPATMVDTVLDLRTTMCQAAGAEVACNDDFSAAVKASTITKSVPAGTYYLVVQGKGAADIGPYTLKVEMFPGQGAACTTAQDCGPGLECRVPAGQTAKVCVGPPCNDTIDDDGDGKTDYPNDPGCSSETDATENDDCPSGPNCPQCGNGIDDDNDGDTDYPNDTSCKAASTMNEACQQSEPVIIATTPTTTGTTVGATDDYRPPAGSFNGHLCSTSGTHTAPDRWVQFDVPAMTNLSLRLTNVDYDSTHVLLDSTCGGTPIECYDSPTSMVVNNLNAGRYYLIVDGYGTGSGAFTLNISGSIKNGESCESPLAQSGALTCGPGYTCGGTAGMRTCRPTECNDGMDNNGDGKTDFPNDPGCTSSSDPVEDTVCPGPSCPACSDGIDNDGDMLIDFPMDTGCVTAAATNEGCPDADPVGAITMPTTTGTLVGASDDHNPSCVSTNAPDKVFTLDIPTSLTSLVIDTEGSAVDTVLSLMTSTCSEPSLACDDEGGVGTGDSLITRNNVSAGSYTIAVDAYGTPLDTFILHVKGTIIPGGSCEGVLFQSGVLVCPTNFACNGPSGSRTCSAAQCLDGVDNNGDGKVDFPDDPACSSPSDNTEDVVCPGASCPACGDGIDNDSDGRTDFPADTACSSASDNTEGCGDSDPIGTITAPATTGTLVGATDDHDPACVTTNGPDLIYTLTVPNLQTLTIDTEGSVVDTVLSFMGTDCSEPALACDDEGGVGTGDSLIQRSFVTAGTYTIAVDAFSTTPNTFNLNVHGVALPGASCEGPLFASGALVCSLGFACDGPAGSRTCKVAQCLDGLDNNGDGKTDYPNDPGCDSFSDNTETTVCPGAACPVCSDGIDNDNDGATDFPADPTCFTASGLSEACVQAEPIAVITSPVINGNTATATNDFAPSCGSSSHSAPDLAYQLNLPQMATLNLNLTLTGGWDSAHALLNSTCGGTPVACSDSPTMTTQTNVPAGTYYVVVDGYGTASGAFTLTTTGTIAVGGSCEGALFQSGAFTCTAGNTCAGMPGSKTCVTAVCNDGMDNDGDGKTDATDPGCLNSSDNDETDTACADGMDNDGDGKTDLMDPGCVNGNDNSETDPACIDGMDNDGDGKTDAADPGCLGSADNDETDGCPAGTPCPVCSNGMDDDTDTFTDFPTDTRCLTPSFPAENLCPPEADLAGQITSVTSSGTLVGKANNFTSQTCQSTTGNDITFALDLPVPVVTLVIDTIGSQSPDTILSLRDATCGTQLGCDDDGDPAGLRSLLVVSNVAAGLYSVVVDAFGTGSTNNAPVKVNVRGIVAPGTACTHTLFAAGVLECAPGTTCTSGTCQ